MLLRFTVTSFVIAALVSAAIVWGSASAAHDPTVPLRLPALLADDCPVGSAAPLPPCWQGIIPGQTTRTEAVARLRRHPWIGAIFENASAISWEWSGAQPASFASQHDGVLRADGDRITQIRLQLSLTVGDVWLTEGPPQRTRLIRPVSLSAMYQIAYYDRGGFYFTSALDCPLLPTDYWRSPVTLGLGDIWLTESINGVEIALYDQPSWWDRLRTFCPRP